MTGFLAVPSFSGGEIKGGAVWILAALIVANGAGAAGKLGPGAATVQGWFTPKK